MASPPLGSCQKYSRRRRSWSGLPFREEKQLRVAAKWAVFTAEHTLKKQIGTPMAALMNVMYEEKKMQRIILFPRAWEFGSSMRWNKWATCSCSCSPLIGCLPHGSCNIFYNELLNQVDTLVQWLALLAVTAPRLRVQSLCVALACSLSGFPGFQKQACEKVLPHSYSSFLPQPRDVLLSWSL